MLLLASSGALPLMTLPGGTLWTPRRQELLYMHIQTSALLRRLLKPSKRGGSLLSCQSCSMLLAGAWEGLSALDCVSVGSLPQTHSCVWGYRCGGSRQRCMQQECLERAA